MSKAKARPEAQDVAQEKKAAMLGALADTGNICNACEIAGVPRRTFYNWREDTAFESAVKDALEEAAERLEFEARRRAYEGTDKPIFQGGRNVGVVREYSDTLLIFLLKGIKPDKYRDNQRVEHAGGLDINVSVSVAEA